MGVLGSWSSSFLLLVVVVGLWAAACNRAMISADVHRRCLRVFSIESSSVEGEVVFVESSDQDRAEVEGPDAVVDFL